MVYASESPSVYSTAARPGQPAGVALSHHREPSEDVPQANEATRETLPSNVSGWFDHFFSFSWWLVPIGIKTLSANFTIIFSLFLKPNWIRFFMVQIKEGGAGSVQSYVYCSCGTLNELNCIELTGMVTHHFVYKKNVKSLSNQVITILSEYFYSSHGKFCWKRCSIQPTKAE